MKIAIGIIMVAILLVIIVKFFELSIITGINSGFNKGLKLQPTETDLYYEGLYKKIRIAYIVMSILTLFYMFVIL